MDIFKINKYILEVLTFEISVTVSVVFKDFDFVVKPSENR